MVKSVLSDIESRDRSHQSLASVTQSEYVVNAQKESITQYPINVVIPSVKFVNRM